MFPDPRTKIQSHRLRALNQPRPLLVYATAHGKPVAVYRVPAHPGRWLRVTAVQDQWRVDDEWWRHEVRRRYLTLLLEDGASLTVFQDLLTGEWYQQSY
ncbi:MAG: hypothetical protein FJX77_00355 [Armatimonadetes bacterium]|nr:hypothetical protein [Armatimonadota bacterium]